MQDTTRDELAYVRGICSEDCDSPIFGWCATCDAKGPFQAPKLCGGHLVLHREHTGHAVRSIYNERVEEVRLG